MARYNFPATDYDDPNSLLALLGSFWTLVYDSRDQLLRYTAGQAQLERQREQDLREHRETHSRFDIPPYHTEHWLRLSLRESDMRRDPRTFASFGDSQGQFGTGFSFGDRREVAGYAFPLPADVRGIGSIFNRITEPSVTLSPFLDFELDLRLGLVIFRSNPFDNSLIPTQRVWDSADAQDRELTLWMSEVQMDWDYLYTHFGYVLDVKMQSSPNYKRVLNAVFNAVSGATSREDVEQLTAAMLGIPLAAADETVEMVEADNKQLIIATGENTYLYPLSAAPLVAVGDVVTQGQPLVDMLRVYELNRRDAPPLPRLSLGEGILPAGCLADLTFENQELPWQVTADVHGITRMEFPVGGFEQDVDWFWDTVHERGVAAGQTLANLLDQRGNKIGEPTAADLPASVNPLQFVVENLLHANLFVIHAKVAGKTEGVGLQWSHLLRRILPPHAAVTMLIELQPVIDSVTMTNGDDVVGALLGLEPLDDVFDVNNGGDTALVPRIVSETCQ